MNQKTSRSKQDNITRMTKSAGKKTPGAFHTRVVEPFRIKLKHVLGGVSLLSLLAAFEVFSIPAASGIIDLFWLTSLSAAEVWFGTAVLTGFAAVYLHREELESDI